MSNPKRREQEQAYLISADNTTEAIKDLVGRETIGGFDLSEPTIHEIEDTYFDTPDNDLRLSKVTLRKRVLDGTTLITLKGIEKRDKDFTQDHSEWEFEWPFMEHGIHPEALLTVAGLEQAQKRDTTRVTRKLQKSVVVPSADPDTDSQEKMTIPLAEMNIDSSLYTTSTGQARLYEVEFELDEDSPLKLKQILKAVESDVDYLQRWDHGKFVTGKAIEFAFGVKTDENGILNLTSFPFIEDMFDLLTVTEKYKSISIKK